jgi:hypothetical protein
VERVLVQRCEPRFPRLVFGQLGNQDIEVMIEAWLDVMVKKQHANELLGRLLAVISRIVVVVCREYSRSFSYPALRGEGTP